MNQLHLDETDVLILQMLSENARVPVKEIAAKAGMSSPAISARIGRLEKNGVLRGYHADVNRGSLGYSVKAFIMVDVSPDNKEAFYEYARKIPNILECNCVTGEYSMMLESVFHQTEELDACINGLHRFGKTRTMIVFSTAIKYRDFPIEPN